MSENEMANAGGSSLAKSGSSASVGSLPAGAKIRISANDDDTVDVVHANAPNERGFVTFGRSLHSEVSPRRAGEIASRLRAAGYEVSVAPSARRLGVS